MNENKHHVAWDDRLKPKIQWQEDRQLCSQTYIFNPNLYPKTVNRFIANIPNIKNGPSLHDDIIEKKEELLKHDFYELLESWKHNHPQLACNESEVDLKKDQIEFELYYKLYIFINQLLEDHGFGFYTSNDPPRGGDGYHSHSEYE